LAFCCDFDSPIGEPLQWVASEFPTQRNREFSNADQGRSFKEEGIAAPGIGNWISGHFFDQYGGRISFVGFDAVETGSAIFNQLSLRGQDKLAPACKLRHEGSIAPIRGCTIYVSLARSLPPSFSSSRKLMVQIISRLNEMDPGDKSKQPWIRRMIDVLVKRAVLDEEIVAIKEVFAALTANGRIVRLHSPDRG
jgi:hypothetical protein